jgi:hypothetical protein
MEYGMKGVYIHREREIVKFNINLRETGWYDMDWIN